MNAKNALQRHVVSQVVIESFSSRVVAASILCSLGSMKCVRELELVVYTLLPDQLSPLAGFASLESFRLRVAEKEDDLSEDGVVDDYMLSWLDMAALLDLTRLTALTLEVPGDWANEASAASGVGHPSLLCGLSICKTWS